jgi:hypothetical protein
MDRQANELGKMVGKLAGRDVNCIADAGTGGLDTGEAYGFHLRFSFIFVRDKALTCQSKKSGKNEKPPAAFAGGGLGAA